jgi:hypothetical protein
MLAFQYEQWAAYPEDLKEQIEIVLVDDGSPEPAVDVPRPEGLPQLRLYRVLVDKPWNQNGCTNLGAFVASGKWLLITDMDHVVSRQLLTYCLRENHVGKVYMFDRIDACDMQPMLDRRGKPKPHPNSYLITKKFYWEVGGHDEWFTGHYGTDRLLRNRIRQMSPIRMIPVPIIHYGRDIIPDASTTTLPRKENRNPKWLEKALANKRRVMDVDKILTLQFPWELVKC